MIETIEDEQQPAAVEVYREVGNQNENVGENEAEGDDERFQQIEGVDDSYDEKLKLSEESLEDVPESSQNMMVEENKAQTHEVALVTNTQGWGDDEDLMIDDIEIDPIDDVFNEESSEIQQTSSQPKLGGWEDDEDLGIDI